MDLREVASGLLFPEGPIAMPDGTVVTRAIEDHGNAVAVLPYDPVRRTAILVQQMRAPALYAAKHRGRNRAVSFDDV